ncbi:hypothetical protein BU25DRAFT_347074 [Macroventuria anomochaeta]|uniref:Uncharacterized protein n=1 Tax=Macroventuria anomochaeta TaxID=301207 RepID=A0ACB6RSE8_9PLEO|nr:uncharacterized protein BU25DRAFT_347074 [Macroventuria anomochaeta]KAF2624966.1 hypothetical protein BU25DRAFT_347074 [Macroventuria anomochaeta]
MLDAPANLPLTPARPRQPSLTQSAPSTQAPASDPSFSLLLSLPRELRDRIYTFALTSPYPFWWPGPAPMKHNVGVKLLQTNKQVYAEAAPVLYTGNKFLFTHPSDCNIFRVVASRHAESMNSVYFRIREKDLRLWTTYLGSKSADRSLRADLPKLKNLWVFMRCGGAGAPRLLGQLGVQGLGGGPQGFGGVGALPPAMAVHVHAVQNALGQQVAALQQQVQHLNHAVGVTGPPVIVPTGAHAGQHHPAPNANQGAAGDANGAQHHVPPPPPPPPPPPAMPFATFATFAAGAVPHHHPQPPASAAAHGQPSHNILTTFLRFERELGIESLCLNPQAGRKREVPDVKIVCIMRVPKPEVSRLVRMYPEELTVDRNGDARTRFRRLHGADICVEISGFEGVQG